jgi:DNA-binding HxlR family transcriptional regulator
VTSPLKPHRSTCPISSSLDVIGDRWSLLIVRDLLFAGYQTYKEFLAAGEGIATNILADRLQRLEGGGIIVSEPDPSDRRRLVYSLTRKGRDLAPVLLELSRWGARYEDGERNEFLDAYDQDREELLARLAVPTIDGGRIDRG